MSSTLYRKYRPKRFADVLGQNHIVKTLTNALAHNRLGQAYLFTGPRGTGKTTLARLLAQAANCSERQDYEPCGHCPPCIAFQENRSLDILEIDAASHTGVDNIRELRETIKLLPTLGKYKIYIIDEAHMLSIGAWNALLKTLEEPPAHVIFILATTAFHKIPATILSRCQRFDFARLPLEKMIEKLTAIAHKEKVEAEPAALSMIALAAEGGMRDAESLLAQVIALEDQHITAEEIANLLGLTPEQTILAFTEALAARDLGTALKLINQLTENGTDLFTFANACLHFFRELLLVTLDPTLSQSLSVNQTKEQREHMIKLSAAFTVPQVVILIELFQTARQAIKTATLPQLPLEIATVKFLFPNMDAPSDPTPPASPPPIPQKSQLENAQTTSPNSLSIKNEEAEITLSSKPIETASSPTQTARASLATVRDRWPALLAGVKERHSSLALVLANAAPLCCEADKIILGTRFAIHKEKLNTKENQLTLGMVFSTLLEIPVKKVETIVDASAIPLQTTPSNPLLVQAMHLLGGKIVQE